MSQTAVQLMLLSTTLSNGIPPSITALLLLLHHCSSRCPATPFQPCSHGSAGEGWAQETPAQNLGTAAITAAETYV
jgi:hypothetical protein